MPQIDNQQPAAYQQPMTLPTAPPQPMYESDARMWSMFIHLASVVGVLISGGLLSLAGVLVIWLVFRERSALVDFHGKEQLNLIITGAIAAVAAFVGTIITLGFGGFVLIPLMIAYGIFAFVISIMAAVAANRGEYYRIPLIFRIVK